VYTGAAPYPPAIPPAGARQPATDPAATQQWAAGGAQQYGAQGYTPGQPPAYAPQGHAPQGYAQTGHPQAAYGQDYAQTGQAAAGHPVPGAPGAPGGFAVEQAPQRRGVNPTPIVLGLVLVGVILGAGWAVMRAFAPVDDPRADPAPAATAPAVSGSPDAATPVAPEPEAPALPVIAGAAQAHEAAACRGEQPEAAPLAVDGDPSTFWFTCTYNDPNFGGLRDGIGFAVTLRDPAPVNSITLITNSAGGNVQVRKTTVENPSEGEVLAEGPIGPTTELRFAQPVVGESFVLWLTQLPQTGDANRLELVEITVQ